MNDIELIYEKVRDRQDVLLTNTFDLNEGFEWNVPVICGETQQGKFWLYADENVSEPYGFEFVFSVEYEKRTRFRKRLVKCHTHWHPQTIEQAIADVEDFMDGKIHFSETLMGVLTKRL